MAAQYTFKKEERLKSRKLIDQLFSKGRVLNDFPVKMLYDFIDAAQPLQAGVTVSKRFFKKATDRNRVKRVLREAYRTQKLPLQLALKHKEQSAIIFFIYTGKELPEWNALSKKVGSLLQKLTLIIEPETK